MKTYQIMGTIAGCTLVFAGLVTILTMQGVHILLAVTGVYLVAIWTMLCMQRRARASFDSKLNIVQRFADQDSHTAARQDRSFRPTAKVTSIYQD